MPGRHDSNMAALPALKPATTYPLRSRNLKSPVTPQTAPAATAQEVFAQSGWKPEYTKPRPLPGTSEEYTQRKKFPRISKPVELIKHDYDVVVIGSGYGGSVAASRMARGRQSVCLLELGREKWPGEYPETTKQAESQLHLSGDFASRDIGPTPISAGDPTSLYHLILGDGQSAFVANGLGGTSLLNANVFLEADDETLKTSPWPEEIRRNPGCLRKYYDRAREVLEPQVYPDNFPKLPKLELLKKQAKILGYEDKFRKVEQTTWFREDGLNSCGVEMKKSKLTGMDSTGVNDGSKSSTLMNYLADAWNWGAEIFTRCEVRYIRKHPKEGYLVFFAWHGSQRSRFGDTFYQDLMWVHAKKMVFLGAGAIGTTEILLRSKEMGLPMSRNIGQGMSGNGDLLSFGYNMNTEVNGISRPDPEPDAPIGPTITGIIDCRDQDNPLDGFVIEEGVLPRALAPFLQFMLEIVPGRVKPLGLSMPTQFSRLMAGIRSRSSGAYTPDGSLERTQTYLIMCHDDNQATLTLKDNKPQLQFRKDRRTQHVCELNEKLQRMTAAFDGTFVNNPFSALNSSQDITVHPIGGASMSSDGTGANGVTNHLGELLTGEDKECYTGLAVVDASVIPAALGANPFATITALAERSVEVLAQQHGITIDYKTKNGKLNLWGQPEHPIFRPEQSANLNEDFVKMALRTNKEGIEFTEIMSGYIHIDDELGDSIEDFEIAETIAKGRCESARFFLSVHAYDINSLLSSDEHQAMLTGTFTHGALPQSPYMVTGGDFRLFCDDPEAPNTKRLQYNFDMVGIDGSKMHFHGYKIIDDTSAFSVLRTWRATTTLSVKLTQTLDREGTEHQDGRQIGRGILVIHPYDLYSELRSFYSSMHSASRFLGYFAKNLAYKFFAPFDYLRWPNYNTIEPWSAKNQPTHTFSVNAGKGVVSRMMVWDPLSTAKQHMDILFIAGASVDESIFALPTIKHNAINYFRKKGYRCFCVVHRVGRDDNAKKGWTTYDARLDIAAAIEKISELRESRKYGKLASKIYIIAHCAGSIALSAGLLNGDIDTSTIAGITASQVFMNPRFALMNRWKASIPYMTTAYSTLSRSDWYDCTSTPTDTFFQLGLNQLLRFYPVNRTDLCNSVVCHRSSFIFGLLWSHQNLNEATHQNLHKYLGGTTMTNQNHLIEMGDKGHVLRSDGTDDLVTPANIERLRGVPILFLSGAENAVYEYDNTLTSFSVLRDQLGEDDYERELFNDYGHLDVWMSEKSHKDVFPRVEEHLETAVLRMKQQGVNGFARP